MNIATNSDSAVPLLPRMAKKLKIIVNSAM